MSAIEVQAQDGGAREHLPRGVSAEASDGLKSDFEEVVLGWQPRGVIHLNFCALLLTRPNVPGAGVCVKAAMRRGRDKKALVKA